MKSVTVISDVCFTIATWSEPWGEVHLQICGNEQLYRNLSDLKSITGLKLIDTDPCLCWSIMWNAAFLLYFTQIPTLVGCSGSAGVKQAKEELLLFFTSRGWSRVCVTKTSLQGQLDTGDWDTEAWHCCWRHSAPEGLRALPHSRNTSGMVWGAQPSICSVASTSKFFKSQPSTC